MSVSETAVEVVSPETAIGLVDETIDRAKDIARLRFLQGTGVGFLVGAGLGGALGFIFCKRQLETKYSQLAAEEIAEMRQHYHAKAIALENAVDKPKLDELVRDQGYSPAEESTMPPMVVTPPVAVMEAAEEAKEDVPEPPPSPSKDPRREEVRNVFRDHAPPEDDWDWHKERAQRSPVKPYVIHRDEREEQQAYDGVTFTYYEADDVVCNELDEVIAGDKREELIGEANLEKFGHGSGDSSIVYIRNDRLEMDMEVIRSPNSYAEEVHGFEPQEPEIRHTDRHRRRRSFDDE